MNEKVVMNEKAVVNEKTLSTQKMRLVRVYLTEQRAQLDKLMKWLHANEVRGVTVFRGIAGYGDSGKLHTAALIDLSLNLPLVVEFFDNCENADKAILAIHELIEHSHIVSWSVELSFGKSSE